jgi:hypothetical protein
MQRMGSNMLGEALIKSVTYMRWFITTKDNGFIKDLEVSTGHEFTEKGIALLASMFTSGALFWSKYLTELTKASEND